MLSSLHQLPRRPPGAPKPPELRHPLEAFINTRKDWIDLDRLAAWLATSPSLADLPFNPSRPTALATLFDAWYLTGSQVHADRLATATSLLLAAGANPDQPSHIECLQGPSTYRYTPLRLLLEKGLGVLPSVTVLLEASAIDPSESSLAILVNTVAVMPLDRTEVLAIAALLIKHGASPMQVCADFTPPLSPIHALLVSRANLDMADALAASMLACADFPPSPALVAAATRHNALDALCYPQALAALASKYRRSANGQAVETAILQAWHGHDGAQRELASWGRALLAASPPVQGQSRRRA